MQTIANLMTKQPWSVQVDDSVTVARRMLAERRIHHLPVLDGGRLVGMVTERELAKVTNGSAATVDGVMTIVEEVDASIPIVDVLETMLEHERDAVVVTRSGNIEGIFTAMDAVRLLRERLRPRKQTSPRTKHA